MNKVSNQTAGRYARTAIRHGRQARHQYRLHRLHRLSHGIGDGQDVRCRERHGQTFGHPKELEATRRPGDYARRGHHDHSGPGRNGRAVHDLPGTPAARGQARYPRDPATDARRITVS